MTLADGCLLVGYVAALAGIWLVAGPGWALIVGGVALLWLGWRVYRAPRDAQ